MALRAFLIGLVGLGAACGPCGGDPIGPGAPSEAAIPPTLSVISDAETDELRELCDQFPQVACVPLGERLRNAEGDAAAAREAFRTGCDGGAGDACVALGRMWRTGQGGERSDVDALRQYRAGCERGDAMGCNNAGILLRDGLGTEADEAEALRLFKGACRADYWVGCDAFGRIVMGHGLEHSSAQEARAELNRACLEGEEVLACVTLAEWARGLEDDEAAARVLYSRACNLDDVPACVEFARLAHAGLGGPQDRATARQLLDVGCRRGILQACVDLADIYDGGHGVDVDPQRAEAFRRHACEAGWLDACPTPAREGSGAE